MSPSFEHDVFLSYSSQDRVRVERLRDRLEAAGLKVWRDGNEIRPGESVPLAIERGLASSRVVVACLSPHALVSDWAAVERASILIDDPANRGGRFVPVLLADTKIEGLLTQYSYIDYRDERNEAEFEKLLAACQAGRDAPLPVCQRPATEAEQRVTRPGLARQVLDRLLPRLHWVLTAAGTLSEPPELPDLRRHLGELGADIQREMRKKTYLPLAGQMRDADRYDAETAGRDPFVAPVHQAILAIIGRARGGDGATPQVAAGDRRSRRVKDVLHRLEHTRDPLVLLGEPGSGKTMTLHHAARTLALREQHRVFPRVPVYVRLGEFHVQGRPVGPDDVRDYVRRALPPPLRPRLEALEHLGRLVVFFDGMDEMSRQRYGEHTAALSEFADASPSRTLFSCRVTDFSPRFLHQRLVILPFDRAQVAEYLRVYVRTFPVRIGGERWGLGRLARYLMRGDLPVEANNPFVLWLLCLYLQEKGAWPQSRVELLGFYNEINFGRKADAARDADEPPFPDRTGVFAEWGRFAYLVTERNLGPAVPRSLLEAGCAPAAVAEAIRVGRICGVLAESRDEAGDRLVRFHHHRFQEFFAARHVHHVRPPVDWLARLDAPRWQETMLNLVLMGGAQHVVDLFAGSIVEQTRLYRTALEEEEAGKTAAVEAARAEGGALADARRLTHPTGSAPIHDPLKAKTDEREVVLADRVELCSRILHQVGKGFPAVRETLMPPFRSAVEVLAEHGSPIAQVKMMRAAQHVPEVDLINALRRPLTSEINWVRSQALIVLAGGAGTRAIGSDLATEIAYDLARGQIPTRTSVYWKAAREARRAGYWCAFAAGVGGYLLYAVSLVAVVLAAYAWASASAPMGNLLHHPASVGLLGVGVLAGIGLALRYESSLLWFGVLGGGYAAAALVPILALLWAGSWEGLEILLACAVGAVAVFGAGGMIAAGIHSAVLSVYLAVTARVRGPGHVLRTVYAGAWRNCGYDSAFSIFKWMAVLGAAGAAVWAVGWVVNRITGTGEDNGFSGLMVVLLVAFAIYACRSAWNTARTTGFAPVLSKLARVVFGVVGVAVVGTLLALSIGGVALVVGGAARDRGPGSWLLVALAVAAAATGIAVFAWRKGMAIAGKALKEWLEVGLTLAGLGVAFWLAPLLWSVVASPLARVSAGVLLLIAAIFAFAVLRHGFALLARAAFPGTGKLPHGSYTPEEWRRLVLGADANAQDDLLNRTEAASLSLSTEEFLEVLRDVAPAIEAEPALSTYWEQRHQVEEILRQERQG